MAADIFYGKGIIHVVPADVIFDHKDCGIFRLGILCVFKILCGFFFQRFVEFFISKSIVQSIYDEILFFVETGFHLILFASGGKYAEQLVIKITDLVGHKSKVSIIVAKKFFKKLSARFFLTGEKIFGKSAFRGLQSTWKGRFGRLLIYDIFCEKGFCRKEKTVLQKNDSRGIGLVNFGNIGYCVSGCNHMFSAGTVLPGNIASHSGKCSWRNRITSIYMIYQILYPFFCK